MAFSTETETTRGSLVTRAAIARATQEVPQDVAALFAWANLPITRYRDFSAARREARARVRERAATVKLQARRRAREAAEDLACASEDAAQLAELQARHHDALARRASGEGRSAECERQNEARRAATLEAKRLLLLAAQSRAEAELHEHAEAAAQAVAHREGREVAEAHASSLRQTFRYETSSARGSSIPHLFNSRALRRDRDEEAQTHSSQERSPSPHTVMRSERFPSRRFSQPITLDAERLTTDVRERTQSPQVDAKDLGAEERVESGLLHQENPLAGAGNLQLSGSGEQGFQRIPEGTCTSDALAPGSPAILPERQGAVPAWLHEHRLVTGGVVDPAPQRVTAAQSGKSTVVDLSASFATRWMAYRPLSAFDQDLASATIKSAPLETVTEGAAEASVQAKHAGEQPLPVSSDL